MTNYEKRRTQVERCSELPAKVRARGARAPEPLRTESEALATTIETLIRWYGELDQKRQELEAELAELAAKAKKRPPKPTS